MRLLVFCVMLSHTLIEAVANPIVMEELPALNQPVSNNAVTLVSTEKGDYLYSFLGLGKGKTWQDTTLEASVLHPGADSWSQLEPLPGMSGRLAASAVSANGAAWVFGGYTVAEDGSEKSVPGVYRIHPGEPGLSHVTDMPIAVEDSVMLVYQDRYIYLVSGWHDLGNVNLVQVLDTKTMAWSQATPWPGEPVFGHAGGIYEDRMLICDGVRIQYHADESPRTFLPASQCWSGRIDSEDHHRIYWRSIPNHPGEPRYRMAATGDMNQRVVFAGGSVNPYNFNGVGYNGVPAETEKSVFSYNFESNEWDQHGDLAHGTMDHRGLLFSKGWYYLVGGMHDPQVVVADVYRFRLE